MNKGATSLVLCCQLSLHFILFLVLIQLSDVWIDLVRYSECVIITSLYLEKGWLSRALPAYSEMQPLDCLCMVTAPVSSGNKCVVG